MWLAPNHSFAHLSGEALREDYQKVLGPGAVIGGPLAA
jgi:hypothetical protein